MEWRMKTPLLNGFPLECPFCRGMDVSEPQGISLLCELVMLDEILRLVRARLPARITDTARIKEDVEKITERFNLTDVQQTIIRNEKWSRLRSIRSLRPDLITVDPPHSLPADDTDFMRALLVMLHGRPTPVPRLPDPIHSAIERARRERLAEVRLEGARIRARIHAERLARDEVEAPFRLFHNALITSFRERLLGVFNEVAPPPAAAPTPPAAAPRRRKCESGKACPTRSRTQRQCRHPGCVKRVCRACHSCLTH